MDHAGEIAAPHVRRLRAASWCAALCALGLALTWVVAAHVPAARESDAAALRGFIGLDRGLVSPLSNGVLALVSPLSCTLFTLGAMAIAARRGRHRLIVAVPVMLIGAIISSELLKPLLAVGHAHVGLGHQVSAASWPSGHSTAVMTMTLSALLVAAPRWRPAVAAIGGVFTVAVGFALLTLAWHMPSDVIGGFLLAALWVSGAVAVLTHLESRAPAGAPRSLGMARTRRALRGHAPGQSRRPAAAPSGGEALVPRVVVGSLTGAALAVLVLRPHQVADFAGAHHSLVAFATVITALAASLVSGFTVALRN
jgi:membrane-associated phospholipid phosphatase